MRSRAYRSVLGPLAIASAVIVAGAACKTSSPAQPSTAGSDSGLGPSLVAPTPVAPSNGGQVAYSSQPVKLVVTNSVSTTSAPLTYTFEVAYDASFASKVQVKDGVVQGSGQTSVTLDPLLPSNTYYWHARSQGGSTTGAFGATYKFSVGGQVSLGAPTPIAPLTGAFVVPRPTLTVGNAPVSGATSGVVTYKFDLASSAAFSPILVTGTAVQGTGQTTFVPPQDLTVGATYFWRATAVSQADGVSSSPSAPQSFVVTPPTQQAILAAQQGLVLWSGVQPPGTNGHAIMGDNWQVQTVNYLGQVTYTSPPIDELRIFDLLDRGYSPQDAINWEKANGYSTIAVYYVVGGGISVIGFQYDYIAQNYLNSAWDLVFRSE